MRLPRRKNFLLIGPAAVKPARPKVNKSFFASFCSQKEALSFYFEPPPPPDDPVPAGPPLVGLPVLPDPTAPLLIPLPPVEPLPIAEPI
jgi:hypothetical protein